MILSSAVADGTNAKQAIDHITNQQRYSFIPSAQNP